MIKKPVLVESKKRLNSIQKKTVIVLLLLIAASLFYKSAKISLGIVVGGCLSLINLKVLSRIAENIFQQTKPNKTPIIISYVIKIFILFGTLYLLITRDLVNIIAFIIGFSAIFIAMFLESIFPCRYSN